MIHDPGHTIMALYGVWIDDELGFAVDNLRNVQIEGLRAFAQSRLSDSLAITASRQSPAKLVR